MVDKQDATALALKYYAETYCEGWCKDAPADANFGDDCGGCRARLALQQSPTTDNSTNKTWQEDH